MKKSSGFSGQKTWRFQRVRSCKKRREKSLCRARARNAQEISEQKKKEEGGGNNKGE